MEDPQAYVTTDTAGNLILVDPIAEAVIGAVERHNRASAKDACDATFELNKDRIDHFRQRLIYHGYRPDEYVIGIISVDDTNGKHLVQKLMPDTDWTPHREGGKTPYARGMIEKIGMLLFIRAIGEEQVADELEEMKQVAVVIVDYGTCKVYP